MKKEIFNKLYNDLIKEIKKEFESFEVKINEKKDDDYIIAYMNWRRRFISDYKRKVICSNEILQNPKYKVYKKSIDKIIYKFRNGENITPFLPKGIVDNPYKENSRKDKDIFLNAVGIHHLHLGNIYDKKKKCGIQFVKRNNDLLYVMIKKDIVYFIDIDIHNFGNLKLFRILKDNWEHLLSGYEIKGIQPSNKEMTDEMLDSLIHSGASVPIELDGKVYAICTLVTSGHNGNWMFDFNSLINQLKDISSMLTINTDTLKNKINQLNNSFFQKVDFTLVIRDGYIYLVEEISSSTIIIDWTTSTCQIFKGYCLKGKHIMDFNY